MTGLIFVGVSEKQNMNLKKKKNRWDICEMKNFHIHFIEIIGW